MNEIITERPNLFEPNVYITVCVEITGTVCPHKLTSAITAAFMANEATMSRIVLDNGVAYYEKLAISGCKIEITKKNWIELVKINEKKPFKLDKGELVRTFIVPTKNNTKVIVMAHHLVGDGKSIIYFIKDIMNSLSGVLPKYKPLTLLTKKVLKETRITGLAKFYTRYCKRKWKNHSYTWQQYYDLHNNYWATVSSDIKYKTLSVVETNQIIKKSKDIGCSVNSYLVTMFLQKQQNKCNVGIPVSIRKKGNESMSNLTSGISINYHFDNKKTFSKNAMKIHSKIKKSLYQNELFVLKFLVELPTTLIDAVLLNNFYHCTNHLVKQTAKIMGYIGNKKRDLGITNLMILDIPTIYGEYKIENIIFVPPAVSYSNNIIGISTVNGKMTISYHNMIKNKKV